MHELGIANSLLEAVRAELQKRPKVVPRKVGLRLGELAGVDGEALSFCFSALVQGSELADVTLEIERCGWQQRCRACGETFAVINYATACPACHSADTVCVGGEELELAYLELEET